MLAYVFWHWPTPEVRPDAYERLQRTFHAALAEAAPGGFVRSRVFRLEGRAPWLLGAPAYADWYLVENSAALDALNTAAISGICEVPHNEAARAAAAGAGSLLTLRGDHPNIDKARHATFLSKPKGMSYAEFYPALEPHQSTETSLWRRTMVLGPNPEFTLLSPRPLTVPDAFQPLSLTLSPL